MKPRTKLEKLVVAESAKLQSITPSQQTWAKGLLIKEGLYEAKTNLIYCLECGKSFFCNDASHEVRCPHCGELIKVKPRHGRKRSKRDSTYINVVTTAAGMQVIRTYRVNKITKPECACSYSFDEAVQIWYTTKGEQVTMARNTYMSYYIDAFSYNTPITVKKNKGLYEIDGYIYPKVKLINELRQRGVTYKVFEHISPYYAVNNLLTRHKDEIETLIKLRKFNILSEMDVSYILLHWNTIKIALRHGFSFDNIPLWQDCISLLNYLGMDERNPKFICPTDTKAWHDEVLEKAEKKREKERKEKEREMIKKREKENEQYIKEKGIYFGLLIVSNDISIEPLKCIAEFVEEGDAQHICVGSDSQKYWKRNSLIFSARVNGERYATIELSLDDYKIKQCFGPCNCITERDAELRSLVKKNIKKIKGIRNLKKVPA